MNGSPPFSNVEDEGQLPGPLTRRTMADNKDDRLQQGRPTRPTNKDQGRRSIHNNQHYVGMIFFNLVLFAVAITLQVCRLFDCCVLVLPHRPPLSFSSSFIILVVCNLFLIVVSLSSLVVLPHCYPWSLASSSFVVRLS